jgi:hypothetical protein
VGPGTCLDAVEKRKNVFPLPAMGCPARSSSPYRLSYPGFEVGLEIIINDTYAVILKKNKWLYF